ncbi:class I SAM-dependent methyltransferase [Aliikangiella marina]|uniref:Class I SAM-dependent methyltransferase n=1 Tax=Aliikangiella marina TaxID=1712262 RepID=A0A545TJD5_9GAMM|nr:class I SAM-dependent methyltransferase [Aliikangiella marina]TQV77281.1 class I SAM-dependent methyltransferase [Aliikangiella marina]
MTTQSPSIKSLFAVGLAATLSLGASYSTEAKDSKSLDEILAAQPEKVQARYTARKPKQTLEFFGIKPGMTVVEALPGGGWYSKIIMPYLGKKGHLIGADYSADMFPLFGFFSQERLDAKKTWVQSWTKEAETWRSDDSATVAAFQLGSLPSAMQEKADAVLFIRALHNLARFESKGGYLTQALADTKNVLKKGGIVGIVQHMAPSDASDEWADGSRGYLKKDFVISKMEAAGFELVASSDINENPKDKPTGDDIVWRLPPSLVTSREDETLKKKYQEIGESNRMTLLFRKK